MRVSRLQLVALLIVALIFGAAQCLASCAAEGSRSAVPPCHQHQVPHHELAASCGHDFLVPPAHRLSAGHAATVALLRPALQQAPSFIVAAAPWALALAPPGSSPALSTNLRI